MDILLSILICTIPSRTSIFLRKLIESLEEQIYLLEKDLQNKVEILYLGDNRKMTVGEKRNKLIDISHGKYIVFIDDDDRINCKYIYEIILAIYNYRSNSVNDVDSVTFDAEITFDGVNPCRVFYSKDLIDVNDPTNHKYFRKTNHLMPIKKEIVVKNKVQFPEKNKGEDFDWAQRIVTHLKSEAKIDKILYYYDYNSNTTTTL